MCNSQKQLHTLIYMYNIFLWLDLHFFNKIICHSKTFWTLEFRWNIILLHFLLSFGQHSFQCGDEYRNTSNAARRGGLWDKRRQGNSHQTMNHLHVSTRRCDEVTGCDKILFHFYITGKVMKYMYKMENPFNE